MFHWNINVKLWVVLQVMAGEEACYQTVVSHNGQLLLLGTKGVFVYTLRNWREVCCHTVQRYLFMHLRSKIGAHIVLSCLSFCYSIILSETFTLQITFKHWVLEVRYFTWVFLVIRPFCGFQQFLAHLSWKLKWAFLITCPSFRPSVRLSVCL